MKKMSKISLESMRTELKVLSISQREKLKGGIIKTDWACLFNCMEYINDRWCGGEKTADDYYQEAKNNLGYDPALGSTTNVDDGVTPRNAELSFNSDSKLRLRSGQATDKGWSSTVEAVTQGGLGATIIMVEGREGKDDTQNGHYVVATGYDARNDQILYEDPYDNTTGAISKNELWASLGVGMDCDDDIIGDDTGNYLDPDPDFDPDLDPELED